MKLQHLYNWKIYFLLLFSLFQLCFDNSTKAQAPSIVWVCPSRADAFPVNGNRTGNTGLNLAFDDFNVIEYIYLDSFYIGLLIHF